MAYNRYTDPPYYITAYGLAVKHGYQGTEEEWLASLQGHDAYTEAVNAGYEGTEQEFYAMLAAAADTAENMPLYLRYSEDAQTLFEAADAAAQSGKTLYILDLISPTPCAFCGTEADQETGATTHIFSAWGGGGSYVEIRLSDADDTYTKTITRTPQDGYSHTPGMLAPEFDETQAYHYGAYVRRYGKLYRHKYAVPMARAWDPAAWEEVTVGTEISRVFKTTMSFGSWSGNDPYSANLIMLPSPPVTAKTKIDLQPSVDQIASMMDDSITALVAVNDLGVSGGTIKAYAFGGIPSFSTVQCTMVEVL